MKETKDELTKLPNIGKVLADNLKLVGINSANDLKSIGTENVFIKLMAVDKDACFSKLCAIEGAIQGIRWHDIDKARKEELKEFFRMAERC